MQGLNAVVCSDLRSRVALHVEFGSSRSVRTDLWMGECDLALATSHMESNTTALLRRAETPYGQVLQYLELSWKGRPYLWPYLNPFALLFYICSTCVAFARMLKDSVAGIVANIIIYADECTPGNVLRPDKGAFVEAWVSRRRKPDKSSWPAFLLGSTIS